MDKYGLIGFPLGHSFSKNYFNEKFENEGINAKYINATLIESFKASCRGKSGNFNFSIILAMRKST